MKAILGTIAAAILLTACGNTQTASLQNQQSADSLKYYAGEFIYYADAAILQDCATGLAIPVTGDAEYLKTEREYLSLKSGDMDMIYVEFIGHTEKRPAMEGDGMQQVVVVDSLIGFNPTRSCDPEASIAGIYEARSAKNKVNLSLDANYNFVQRVFDINDGQKEETYMGVWARTAENKIMLIYDYQGKQKQDQKTMLLLDSENKTLIEIAGTDQLIYQRVYM